MAEKAEIHHDAGDGARVLARLIAPGRRLVAFTGAGISTECGVPDFRSPGSPWLVNKPIPFAAFVSSRQARIEAWRRKFTMDDHFAGARPGRGHMALARLAATGRMSAVITQNIDGLHQASGLAQDAVIELHGNGTYATCLSCGARHELAPLRRHFETEGTPPVCEVCGGIVKSATVSFGQAMPQASLRRAQELALDCDLFLAIGSSLVVFPAAYLPVIAVKNGATLVIINRESTEMDALARLVIRADIGDVLDQIGL